MSEENPYTFQSDVYAFGEWHWCRDNGDNGGVNGDNGDDNGDTGGDNGDNGGDYGDSGCVSEQYSNDWDTDHAQAAK